MPARVRGDAGGLAGGFRLAIASSVQGRSESRLDRAVWERKKPFSTSACSGVASTDNLNVRYTIFFPGMLHRRPLFTHSITFQNPTC